MKTVIHKATRTMSITTRALMYLLIWWALTDGTAASWWIGIPAVVFAVTISILLLPPVPINVIEFVKFIPVFLSRSLLGGIDVAWRAYHPKMPVDPDLIEYPIRLPPGLPQVFMANTINLLPGTLSTTLDRNTMKVHVLDRQKAFLNEIETVENSVARIFGLSLNTPS